MTICKIDNLKKMTLMNHTDEDDDEDFIKEDDDNVDEDFLTMNHEG